MGRREQDLEGAFPDEAESESESGPPPQGIFNRQFYMRVEKAGENNRDNLLPIARLRQSSKNFIAMAPQYFRPVVVLVFAIN